MSKHIVFLSFIFGIICSCNNIDENIYLKKIDLTKEKRLSLKNIKEFPDRNIYLMRLDRERGFGDFDTDYALMKEEGNRQIIYQIKSPNKKTVVVISDEYFAFVKPYKGYKNYGWISLKEGHTCKLPYIDRIVDSIQLEYDSCFVSEINGFIDIYEDGKAIKTLNYGEFILSDKDIDNLSYGLYKLDSDLMLISEDGNDFKGQIDGVFYIPSPGYGVVFKYKLENMINSFDSIVSIGNLTNHISFKIE